MKNLAKHNPLRYPDFENDFSRITSMNLENRMDTGYGMSSRDEKRHGKKIIAAAKTRVRHVEAARRALCPLIPF